MTEVMTKDEIVLDYISEIRHHLDTGDLDTANIILDLLGDMFGDDIEWRSEALGNDDYCELDDPDAFFDDSIEEVGLSDGFYYNTDDEDFFENVW